MGISSIFIVKQLDFLILGLDHLVNSYNIIRNQPKFDSTSFTIMPIVMDEGYQGPQSSFNNLSDMCSMARVPGFCITTKWEIEQILSNHLITPGFRIISVSQRLSKKELLAPEKLYYVNESNTVFQYSNGIDVTIVCFNFSFPQGYELYQELLKNNIDATIFNVTSSTPTEWSEIIKNIKHTKKLIILDDSKSHNLSCYALINDLNAISLTKKILITKPFASDWFNPNQDLLEVNIKNILDELTNS